MARVNMLLMAHYEGQLRSLCSQPYKHSITALCHLSLSPKRLIPEVEGVFTACSGDASALQYQVHIQLIIHRV
jgi:hypothetical protein